MTPSSTVEEVLRPDRAGDADLRAAATLFRGLGDPARLTILRHLALGEHRVVDLTAHLGLAQSTMSGHLACLRDCGLVLARPEGRSTRWSLARPELLELLEVAERLLAVTGHAVVLCPSSGAGSDSPGSDSPASDGPASDGGVAR